MTMSRLLARPMLSSIFVVGPAKTLQDPKPAAERADKVTRHIVATLRKLGVQAPEDPLFWVRLNAGVQLVAAAGLATGKMPRLSAAVLAGSIVPTTLAGHDFWNESDPSVRNQQLIQAAKNLSLLGGLVIAANDTNGRPGVAWMARHAVKDARREARIATMDASLGAGALGAAIAAAGRHAKDSLQQAAHQAATSDTAHRLADRATELAATAREQAPVVAAAARDNLATIAETAREQAPVVAAAARDNLATFADTAREEVEPMAKDLRKRARSAAKSTAKDARKTYRRQRKHVRRQLADIQGR